MLFELVEKYRERYDDVGYSENILYPGIARTLSRLTIDGIPMGICTSKRAVAAERVLDWFGLCSHFSFLSGGNIGLSKTEQLRCLVDRGAVDHRSIMIGDRSTDVAAGRANRLRSAGVLWGHGSREELQRASPDFLLEAPSRLLDLVATSNETLHLTDFARR